MKIKHIISILAVLPFVAGLSGCKSDDELTAKPAKEILRVEGGGVELRAGDTSVDVQVYADCAWTVLDTKGGDFGNKLSVSPKAGNGNGTLVIMVDENTGTAERKDTIILKSAGGLMQKIPIRQVSGDPAMNVSTASFSFPADEVESMPFVINSNENWTLTLPPNAWFHVNDANGAPVTSGTRGSTTVFVIADKADSDADRSSLFTINYSGKSVNVEVSQKGMTDIYLHATDELREIDSHGGERMLKVESNAAWHAYIPQSAAEWLRVEPAQGSGNGEIRVMCEPNNTTRDRLSSIVLIAGSKNPRQQVIQVEQLANGSVQPLQTSVSLSQLSVSRESATFLINIVSEQVVGDFGLVYTDHDYIEPTLEEGEHVVIDHGGTSRGVAYKLTGLNEDTRYIVRAFVRKQNSQEVVYSEPIEIRTNASILTIGQLKSLYVYNTSAEFRYSFVSDTDVISYGLVYSATNQEPSNENGEMVKVGDGGTGGNVMGVITNLQEMTTYYVRAYVLTHNGHSYSPNVVTITTSASQHEPGESDNPDPTLAPRR